MGKRKAAKRRPFGSIVERKGRPGYYVRFTVHGTRVERAGGPTRAVARKLLAATEALLASGHTLQDVLASVFSESVGARLTFKAAAGLYLEYASARKRESTLKRDAQRLRTMSAAPWANAPLSSLRPDVLMAWFTDREKPRKVTRLRERRADETPQEYRRAKDKTEEAERPGTSSATLNRYRALGSALYSWAARAGHVERGTNPFRMTEAYSERGRERVTFLVAEECAGLLDSCPDLLRPLVLAALHTGARRGELLGLEWRDVDRERQELFLRPENEKAGRGRTVPLTAELAAEFEYLRGARPLPSIDGTDRVFVNHEGRPIKVEYVRKAFARAVAATDAIKPERKPTVTLHVLRHTAASILATAGVSEFVIGRVLGQSSASVRARYQHLFPETARGAADVLGSALSSAPRRGTKLA